MSLIHGNFWKHLKSIRTDGENTVYEARIPVLMFLISASDSKRHRTWHGVSTIMEHTGYSKAPVTEALAWLSDHGAIYNVPKEARVGNEKRVHGNRKVWQLTGIMQIGDSIIDYLFIKDEDRESSLIELCDHAPVNVKMMLYKLGLIDEPKEIGLQNEPKLGSQDDIENSEIGSQNAPEIGSQNDTAKELGKENLVSSEHGKASTYTSPINEFEANTVIAAWLKHSDISAKLNDVLSIRRYTDTALKLIEDLNVTLEEVELCTQIQVNKPRNGAYMFWYLLKDIPELRDKAKQLAIIEAEKVVVPSHKPMQLDTSPGMSETERQEALEALRKVKEKIAG